MLTEKTIGWKRQSGCGRWEDLLVWLLWWPTPRCFYLPWNPFSHWRYLNWRYLKHKRSWAKAIFTAENDCFYLLKQWLRSPRSLLLKSPENFRAYFECHDSPLYLRNAEVLSHQTSQSPVLVFYTLKLLKDQLFKKSGWQSNNWLLLLETLSGLSRNRPQLLNFILWYISLLLCNGLSDFAV